MRALAIGLLLFAGASLFVEGPAKQIIRTAGSSNLPSSAAVRSENFVYVAGLLATDEQGAVVPGDSRLQCERILERASALLKGAGSNLARVATVTVYLRSQADYAGMNEALRAAWPTDPPARTTVMVDNLVAGDARVEMSMIAVVNGAERKVVTPEAWRPMAYSYGILSGNTLFLAGLVSRNPKAGVNVPGDMKAQVKTALDNGDAVLKAAGLSFQDVVVARVYVGDVAMFEEMNSVYRTYFPTDPPPRATVKTGFPSSQYLVEIALVAIKGASRDIITTSDADKSPAQQNSNVSSAIRVGNRLYIAGITGNTDTNKGDAKAQTREALARVGRTLKAGGYDWSNLIDGIVYIRDLKHFSAINEAYTEVLGKDFPARATVEVPMMNTDALVEIMFTAAK